MNCLVVGLVEMIGSNKPNYKLHLRLGCGREAITQVWEAGASLSATDGCLGMSHEHFALELETKIHPDVRNHGEGPY